MLKLWVLREALSSVLGHRLTQLKALKRIKQAPVSPGSDNCHCSALFFLTVETKNIFNKFFLSGGFSPLLCGQPPQQRGQRRHEEGRSSSALGWEKLGKGLKSGRVGKNVYAHPPAIGRSRRRRKMQTVMVKWKFIAIKIGSSFISSGREWSQHQDFLCYGCAGLHSSQ